MASLLEAGFKQSVRMVADHMGFRIDPNIRTIQEIAVATADIDYDPFPITTGTRGRTPVPLAGPGRRRAGDHGGGQLADG